MKMVAVEWQKWWQMKRLKMPCFQGFSAFGGSSGSTFNSEEGKGIEILWVIASMRKDKNGVVFTATTATNSTKSL